MTAVLPFLFDYTSWSSWQDWADQHAGRLVLILVFLFGAWWIFRRVVGRMFVRAIASAAARRGENAQLIKRRADTLMATATWAFGIFLFFLGAGLLLSEFGLNVSALIAGVGVVGIALGLGAQTLVKDVINGMFILIEDQYAVGDVVTVAGATGEVVEINPRRTVVRDGEGNVYSIPNSTITVAVNKTPSLRRVRVGIQVPFRESERAIKLADDVGIEVATTLPADVISPPRVASQRVNGDGDVVLELVGDARTPGRWGVEVELRRRLKRRFDAARVEMRFEGNGGEAADGKGK